MRSRTRLRWQLGWVARFTGELVRLSGCYTQSEEGFLNGLPRGICPERRTKIGNGLLSSPELPVDIGPQFMSARTVRREFDRLVSIGERGAGLKQAHISPRTCDISRGIVRGDAKSFRKVGNGARVILHEVAGSRSCGIRKIILWVDFYGLRRVGNGSGIALLCDLGGRASTERQLIPGIEAQSLRIVRDCVRGSTRAEGCERPVEIDLGVVTVEFGRPR